MGVFDNATSVVMNNKVVSSIVTDNGGVLYQKTGATSLSINVPLNLVYSDAFSITGYLKDSNNTGLVGETVYLKVGSTIVDSTTTTTGGAYSFTETPVATGNHSFQVTYDGNLENEASVSSIVNRNIGKETTVLSVSVNKQKYKTGETATATITLTDDDGTPLNNASVSYTIGSTSNSATTNSNGVATVTFTVSDVTSIYCSYPTNSNYSASSDSASFSIVTPTVLSLTSSTPIIESGDSATVNLVLLDQDGDAISGESVSYTISHGGTTISSSSVTTDSNGEASLSYTGTGVGNVSVVVTYGLLQETYELEDCYFYSQSGSQTYSSTSYSIENLFDMNGISGDFEISATLQSTANKGVALGLNTANTNENKNLLRISVDGSADLAIVRMSNGNAVENYYTGAKYTANTDLPVKLTRINGVYTAYDGSLTHTYSSPPSNLRYVQLESWNTAKTVTYTDFKVKAL